MVNRDCRALSVNLDAKRKHCFYQLVRHTDFISVLADSLNYLQNHQMILKC